MLVASVHYRGGRTGQIGPFAPRRHTYDVAVTTASFDSYAQNGEDVVLWRALRHIEKGRYIEVGANSPTEGSISRPFYDRGWHGMTVEPMPAFAKMHRAERPRDLLVEAAVTATPGERVLHEIEGTGLSTLVDTISDQHRAAGWEVHDIRVPARRLDDLIEQAGWDDADIHFLVVDVEGAEEDVIRSADLSRWRPWVLVIESTSPNSTEPTHESWEPIVLQAGYDFCLFDGLSRFYVAKEHAAELAPLLSYPASVVDNYSTFTQRRLEQEAQELRSQLAAAQADAERTRAELRELQHAHHELSQAHHELSQEHHRATLELSALRMSVRWRVTHPVEALMSRRSRGTG